MVLGLPADLGGVVSPEPEGPHPNGLVCDMLKTPQVWEKPTVMQLADIESSKGGNSDGSDGGGIFTGS